MLLPSALSCDVRRSSRLTPFSSTPPPAPSSFSDRAYPAGNGLLGTCRALQALLSGSPAPSPRRTPKPQPPQLQSPFTVTPPRRSPRTRKVARPASPRPTPPPAIIASTPPPPPSAPARGTRSANKRRRAEWDDNEDSDGGFGRPLSTPKRRRHIPYELPIGLSSADFYSLHSPPVTQSPPSPPRREILPQIQASIPHTYIHPDAVLPSIEAADEPYRVSSETWAAEDNQRLVETILAQFRPTQQQWDECARQIGRPSGADIAHQWDALLQQGRIGLRHS
ncbi:Uncharacterized protein PECH_008644 [Penicillium ucsense]|uniref:Myb-like domain-containing protein n=1 Tax=Penicillium ucsense TaxID=2839758 RepID=A0A8J8W4Y7_9EURO|nr:Uncharacterized protein PECM_005219 [Penicillium ucsense]KAF7738651.1 Uncharacterized protein PECH_008644 [Penicillium ucsense]